MMKPDKKLISINSSEEKIIEFIYDMIVYPRKKAHYWSQITNQTPNLKIGYTFQHLASLITGMKGTATGARGDDLIDKSEVKGCNKIDQSDKCMDCKNNVLRIYDNCKVCGSKNIKRNNDSKWLISIRTRDELNMALNETPRFIFIVSDYKEFKSNNFNDLRIRAFEIWLKSDRNKNFRTLLENYYKYLYEAHKKVDNNSNPAPKNLFPDNFPFYMCNPIKTFECNINNSLSDNPDIRIIHYVKPDIDRTKIESENMPIELLNTKEKNILKSNKIDIKNLSFIDEKMRALLSLRETDKNMKNNSKKTT
nr:MamI family restriction endonuclease [Brachyspira sp. G79]